VVGSAVDRPTDVQVLGASSTSLVVTWDAVSPAITHYRVFYRAVGDATSAESDVTAQRQQQQRQRALIGDLCAFCEYNVSVVAYGADGTGHAADAVIGRTPSDRQFRCVSVHC